VWVLLQKEEVSKPFGVPASLQQGTAGVWGARSWCGAASEKTPHSSCPHAGLGRGWLFGSLFPALLHPCWLGLGDACSPGPAVGIWGGSMGPGGPQTLLRLPRHPWGSTELLGVSKPHAREGKTLLCRRAKEGRAHS